MRPGLVTKEQLESMQEYPDQDYPEFCPGCGKTKCECERKEYGND